MQLSRTPNDLDAPVMYLGKEITANSWGCRTVHSMYYSEWADRNKYETAVTVGFVRSANAAFDKINGHKGPITSKPVK